MKKMPSKFSLYNTLTRELEAFSPLGEAVRMYSCGPTVYDHIHIGNLRGFAMADMLRRALTINGYEVEHVMNLTDVDDKTIQRSQELYPDVDPMQALKNLGHYYTDVFIRDTRAIGNDNQALTFINATDAIENMQHLIRRLYQQGFAYIAEDGVYFSIEAYQSSGKTYGQLVTVDASNTSAARINNDEYDKDSVHDFVLWKVKGEGEPAWEFTLDEHNLTGRPGWHIECSAMSTGQLGQPFDIHTGGVDLMFPHHENEIAQSTAGAEEPYARYFVHNEHLLVENQKMAKSRNNFVTLPDIEARGCDPLAFRLLVLQAHYRSQLNFTWQGLEAAHHFLGSISAFGDLQFQPVADGPTLDLSASRQVISEALADDLDTPRALAELSSLIDTTVVVSEDQIDEFREFLQFLDTAFGFGLGDREDITSEQRDLISRREKARAEHDYTEADAVRDQLAEHGIGLRDTPYGAVWHRHA